MPKNNKLPLIKIISGGQTGADVAGLDAALELKLLTGGWIPDGFKTLDGDKPEYATKYGLVRTLQSTYPPRTALNVRDSDGTVRFASNWDSPGEKLTLRMIESYNTAHWDIDVGEHWTAKDHVDYPQYLKQQMKDFRTFLSLNNIKTLNVAGNSEQSAPGIYQFVYDLLIAALKGYV